MQPSLQLLSPSSLGYGWPTSSHQSFLDHEKTLHMLDKYVCNEKFPCLKFISLPEMIAFSWEEDSVCQMVCKDFKVDKLEQTRFWSIYSKCISQKLNKKRAEISNLMQKAFKGRLIFLLYFPIICTHNFLLQSFTIRKHRVVQTEWKRFCQKI